MALESIQCPNCSAPIQITDEAAPVVCLYCGGTIAKKSGNANTMQRGVPEPSGVQETQTENLMSLAAQEWKAGKWKKADELYSKVLELDPKNSEAWYGRARSSATFGVAFSYLMYAADCSRDKELMLFRAGDLITSWHPDDTGALLEYCVNGFIEKNPENAGGWFLKARCLAQLCYARRADPDDVFLHYRKALELVGNDEEKRTIILNMLFEEARDLKRSVGDYDGTDDFTIFLKEDEREKYLTLSPKEKAVIENRSLYIEFAKQDLIKKKNHRRFLFQYLTFIQALKSPLPSDLDAWWKVNGPIRTTGDPAQEVIHQTPTPVPDREPNEVPTAKPSNISTGSPGFPPQVKQNGIESKKYFKMGGIGFAIWIVLFAVFGSLLSEKVIDGKGALAVIVAVVIMFGAPTIFVLLVVGLIKRVKERRRR